MPSEYPKEGVTQSFDPKVQEEIRRLLRAKRRNPDPYGYADLSEEERRIAGEWLMMFGNGPEMHNPKHLKELKDGAEKAIKELGGGEATHIHPPHAKGYITP